MVLSLSALLKTTSPANFMTKSPHPQNGHPHLQHLTPQMFPPLFYPKPMPMPFALCSKKRSQPFVNITLYHRPAIQKPNPFTQYVSINPINARKISCLPIWFSRWHWDMRITLNTCGLVILIPSFIRILCTKQSGVCLRIR